MPRTPTRSPVDDVLSEAIKDIGPDDIDSDWLDKMVKRLFRELNKQLARIEATKPDDNDTKKASVRTANVRTLDAIERTLERLARMEQERISRRQMKTVVRNDELRAQLQRKIDNLLTYQGSAEASEEADG